MRMTDMMGAMIFLALFACGCSQPVKNLKPGPGEIICFGDSITAGYGVQPEQAYPYLLSARTGRQFVNAGVSGETSAAGLERMEQDVLSRSPKMVLIEFGGNDYLQKVPVRETVSNVEKMIERAQSRGIAVAVADLGRRIGMPDYGGEYKKLCKKHQALFIPDLLKGIADTPGMTSDGIHPVPEGQKMLADKIYAALKPHL